MIISDVNLLAPTITLAVGIALGYAFRGLIAREERAAHNTLERTYAEVISDLSFLKQRFDLLLAARKAQVEKAL